MYTHILKQNLNFNALGASGERTLPVLEALIMNEETIQIIDMKATILDPALNQLKQMCMDSVVSYIQLLL